MQYCINIIKSNQIKSGIICFKQYFLKIFLIALLSFILLFSISCNDVYKPFGYDIPTILGSPARRWFGHHEGDFKRVKLEVNPETAKNIAEAKIIFPETYSVQISLIDDLENQSSAYWVDAPHSTITNATLYGYDEYKSFNGNKEYYNYNTRIDNGNVKSYIKFTHDIDNSADMITDYIVAIITNGMSIRATYTGTLISTDGPIE